MQADTISRLQNMSSIVKTPSPLSGIQTQQQQQHHPHHAHPSHHHQQAQQQRPSSSSSSNNSGQLDNIFNSVKRQIDQWGENAKWKIDLVLLENPQQQQQQPSNSLHPLLSPQHLHPNVITTPSNNHNSNNNSNYKDNIHTSSGDSIGPSTTLSLPVTSTIQYPWDYVAPTTNNDWNKNSDDLQQKLRELLERQKYLESVIWSQAEQIKHASIIPDKDHAINTMKSIFLMSQNEQRMHYILESNLLHKDIETLSKKLQKMASILTDIENMELPTEDTQLDKDTLLSDRKVLLRKLHLAELRLSARDAEIDYLHEVVESLKSGHLQPSSPYMSNNGSIITSSPKPSSSSSAAFGKKLRKGPPYLFQQQYSPRSSEVRSSEQHPLSGLDSLGIVADQMLSDPEFETSTTTQRTSGEKRLRSRLDDRRSQRSIDSAATLLAMPQLMVPQRRAERSQEQSTSLSPEQSKQQPFEHNIPKKPRSTYTRWTEAEDALLRKAVKKYGHSNWEACSKDVHGRSNIQCRNRWIRHLEHRIVEEPKEEEEHPVAAESSRPYHTTIAEPQTSPATSSNARQSPSIAALLNSNDDRGYSGYSPRSTPKQLYDHGSSEAAHHTTKEAAAGPSTTSAPAPAASSSSYQHHPPTYRPPSPMATPKGGKRREPEDISPPPPHKQSNKW